MHISIIKLPETVCCDRRFQGTLVQGKYHALYDFLHERVETGIVLVSKPLFIINKRTDYLKRKISPASYDSYSCIPVLLEQASENTVYIPAYTTLSLLVYSSYKNINKVYLYPSKQVHKRRLTPARYVLTLCRTED